MIIYGLEIYRKASLPACYLEDDVVAAHHDIDNAVLSKMCLDRAVGGCKHTYVAVAGAAGCLSSTGSTAPNGSTVR